MFIIKAIVKLVFKLILFPVQLLLYFVSFMAQGILSLSGIVVIPMILLFAGGAIVCAMEQQWMTATVGAAMVTAVFLFYFASGIILGIVEFVAGCIGEFIFS
jgi:hypothetical protein